MCVRGEGGKDMVSLNPSNHFEFVSQCFVSLVTEACRYLMPIQLFIMVYLFSSAHKMSHHSVHIYNSSINTTEIQKAKAKDVRVFLHKSS